MYTLTADETVIIRDEDGASIPVATGNRHYTEYLDWVAAGNTPTAYSAPPITTIDVDAERDRRIALGVTITIDATQTQIPVQTRNETDFRNINGLVSQVLVYSIMGSNETIAFRDANNTVHELTPTEMIELGSDVAAHVQAIYSAAWQLKSGVIPGDYADDQHWPS